MRTVEEQYKICFGKASIYYGQEASLSDEQVRRAANIFAVKNTWKEYNEYLQRMKETSEKIS
jgi:hypothetical protein